MDSAIITLGVLAVAAFFFATEIIPLAVTAMGASIALGLLGVLTTPVATPPNTLILVPGHFKFMDYVKVGVPLVVVSLIVCCLVIPFFWPFYP